MALWRARSFPWGLPILLIIEEPLISTGVASSASNPAVCSVEVEGGSCYGIGAAGGYLLPVFVQCGLQYGEGVDEVCGEAEPLPYHPLQACLIPAALAQLKLLLRLSAGELRLQKKRKLGSETAGSLLTSSDWLPARHGLDSSSYVLENNCSDKLPALVGWPAHTQPDQLDKINFQASKAGF